ncbi:MAG: hypothetical protein WBQ53_09355 [Methylocystis sp.]
MNHEFRKFIDDAAAIKTSGRWAAMNVKIERLAAKPGVGNEWYVQTFGSLCYQVLSEYYLLKDAYDEKRNNDASLLAWRARNILELSVWSTYFTKSRENARRLYEDAGRDVLDILSVFEKWGQITAQSSDWIRPLTSEKQDLSQRAAAEGIESLEGSYKRVAHAANDCGTEFFNNYSLGFKMLSKFAHPTAMQILGASDESKHALQRDCFFSQGCLFFTGAFVALESEGS